MEITNNTNGQVSIKGICDHCNNITFQSILKVEVPWFEGNPTSYILSKCTICEGITFRCRPGDLREETGLAVGSVSKSHELAFEQLWPPSATFSLEVPDRIRAIYEEACLIKRKSPSSFVVQLRRAFEALAKDRQAPGRTLSSQMEWLISQGQLPGVFAEMMHIARMIGNAGAHDSEKEITPDDVEVADRFFKAIIEYLYIAPALLKSAKGASNPGQIVPSSSDQG